MGETIEVIAWVCKQRWLGSRLASKFINAGAGSGAGSNTYWVIIANP
jgi:hypothetical protein